MAIKSGFFMSVGGDRRYKTDFFAEFFGTLITNGVFPNPSNGMQVIANNDMTVTIKSGKAWINGYYVNNDSDYIRTLDIADGVLKRIDKIVLQLNLLNREILIVVKKGALASSPVAPNLQRDTDIYELGLADVVIDNGAISISQSNITDLRLNNEYCGIVHGTVDQVDTTTIFNQYLNWFNETKTTASSELEAFQMEKQTEFQTWFDSVKGILEGDVAATLSAQISALSEKVTTLENDSATKQEIQTLSETVKSHKNEEATISTKGHVQLTSAINSESETLAATAKAVKTVMDRANEAFTQANNSKNGVVGVIGSPAITDNTFAEVIGILQTIKNTLASNLTAKGQSSVGTEALMGLVNKIPDISTGVKYAEGTITITNAGENYVRGLAFKPRIGVFYKNESAYSLGISGMYAIGSSTGFAAGAYCNGSQYGDSLFYSSSDYFRMKVPVTGEFRWHAWGY